MREGRWQLHNYDELEWVATGFQTYAHDQLNGPSELTVRGTTERGEYRDGKREGLWVTKTDNDHTRSVHFADDKKEGELREVDANGVPILTEHYKAGALSGARESAVMPSISQ